MLFEKSDVERAALESNNDRAESSLSNIISTIESITTPNIGPKYKVDFSNYPKQIHHFASNKNDRNNYTKAFEKIAKKYKLDLDGKWNKELLHHKGSHPKEYHEFVLEGMKRASKEAGRNKEKFLELFEKYVKEPVCKDPGMLDKAWWK